MKKKDIKKKKKTSVLVVTTVIMGIMTVLCSLFVAYQLSVLEEGILDVCATQQDAYVQLVLDQINLKENREDEEIITDILSTLDSSSNKYWTFSKEHAMLYVKDILETNRYKGLTTISYFDSDSAKDFLKGLQLNRVNHKNIIIDGKDYVASGVLFHYGEEDYRLCLLTNRAVLLNNNHFLESKIEMVLLVAVMLITLLVSSMLLARKQEKLTAVISSREDEIQQLQGVVAQLNQMLTQKEYYDTRRQIWNGDVLKEFLEKLQKKKVEKVAVVQVKCKNEQEKNEILKKAIVIIDKKVLRFSLNQNELLFLFLQYDDMNFIKNNMELLLNCEMDGNQMEELELGGLNVDEYISRLNAEV